MYFVRNETESDCYSCVGVQCGFLRTHTYRHTHKKTFQKQSFHVTLIVFDEKWNEP